LVDLSYLNRRVGTAIATMSIFERRDGEILDPGSSPATAFCHAF
jgi:hypothetical protein